MSCGSHSPRAIRPPFRRDPASSQALSHVTIPTRGEAPPGNALIAIPPGLQTLPGGLNSLDRLPLPTFRSPTRDRLPRPPLPVAMCSHCESRAMQRRAGIGLSVTKATLGRSLSNGAG